MQASVNDYVIIHPRGTPARFSPYEIVYAMPMGHHVSCMSKMNECIIFTLPFSLICFLFLCRGSCYVSHEAMTIEELNSDLEFLYRSGQWYCRISRQLPYRSQTKRLMLPNEASLWQNLREKITNDGEGITR